MAGGFIELSKEKLDTPTGITELNNMLRQLYELISGDGKNTKVYYGYGSPEGVVVAGIGSSYMRKDGGVGTSVYMKESGAGATGWVAMKSWANIIENRTDDPGSPATGQVWFRTDV